jgi:hypothetical protein
MTRSSNANHYGTLVERAAAEEFRLELDRGSWHDARRPDGTPVEIKSTMREHADGQPGNFKLYRQYHERLRSAGGEYLFGVYRIRGRGVQVLAWERRPAARLPTVRWHGGGDHRDTQQAKVAIGDVF